MTMSGTRRRPFVLGGVAGVALIVCGAAWWKLIAANSRPSPMHWLDYHTPEGKRIKEQLFCHGPRLLDGNTLWCFCSVNLSSKHQHLYRIDLERRTAKAMPGKAHGKRIRLIAPRPDGSFAMCSANGECSMVQASKGVEKLPPLRHSYLRGLTWLKGKLYAVARRYNKPAVVYVLSGKGWKIDKQVDHGLTPAKQIRLDLGYHDGARWQFLFSRAPERVKRGPVPIELYVAGTDSPAKSVLKFSLPSDKKFGFHRMFLLPIDGVEGNIVVASTIGRRKNLIQYKNNRWTLRNSNLVREQVYRLDGNRLRRLDHLWRPNVTVIGGKQLGIGYKHGSFVFDAAGTRGPRFATDSLWMALLLPRKPQGYWVVAGDQIAKLDASYRRLDGVALSDRFGMLNHKFERWAHYSDYYLEGQAAKKASLYLLLLLLPLAWLIAGPLYFLLRRKYERTLEVCVFSTSGIYLLMALIFWSKFSGMMSRL